MAALFGSPWAHLRPRSVAARASAAFSPAVVAFMARTPPTFAAVVVVVVGAEGVAAPRRRATTARARRSASALSKGVIAWARVRVTPARPTRITTKSMYCSMVVVSTEIGIVTRRAEVSSATLGNDMRLTLIVPKVRPVAGGSPGSGLASWSARVFSITVARQSGSSVRANTARAWRALATVETKPIEFWAVAPLSASLKSGESALVGLSVVVSKVRLTPTQSASSPLMSGPESSSVCGVPSHPVGRSASCSTAAAAAAVSALMSWAVVVVLLAVVLVPPPPPQALATRASPATVDAKVRRQCLPLLIVISRFVRRVDGCLDRGVPPAGPTGPMVLTGGPDGPVTGSASRTP
jgi:hypothetical protein